MTPRAVLTAGTLLGRFVLALVFAISAVGKISAPGLFRTMVEEYHVLPHVLVTPFAYGLPWIEALLALYLILGLFLRFAGTATALLLIMFIGALAIQIARGTVAHGCGCLPAGGPLASLPMVEWLAGGATIGAFDIIRDIVFLGFAVLVAVGDHTTLSLDGWRTAGIHAQDDDDDLEDGGDTDRLPVLRGGKI
ncbi:MAG: hypothetical protein NVSMB65_11320 [Chloroflexota bacterium]